MRHARCAMELSPWQLSMKTGASPAGTKQLLHVVSAVVLAAHSLILGIAFAQTPTEERVAMINEVWDVVENEFYDPQLHGLDGAAIRAEFQDR